MRGGAPAVGYPALVLDPHSTEVVSGMLLTSKDLRRQWDVLDAFEGPAYDRVNIIVTTTDGTERSAQTYALRPNP